MSLKTTYHFNVKFVIFVCLTNVLEILVSMTYKFVTHFSIHTYESSVYIFQSIN